MSLIKELFLKAMVSIFRKPKETEEPLPVENEPLKPEEDGLYPVEYLATIPPTQLSKEAQIKVFNRYAKPLANPLCITCFGRGYTGFNTTTKSLQMCYCVEKNVADKFAELIPEEDRKVNLILPKGLE